MRITRLFASKRKWQKWHCAYCFGPIKMIGGEWVHQNSEDATVCGRPWPRKGWGSD